MVEACTGTAAVVAWWSAVTCSPAPADTRLTGLLASSPRFWGLRKSGVVTRLGVLPAEVLANSRLLPSREVMGIVPLDARAVERIERFVYLDTGVHQWGWVSIYVGPNPPQSKYITIFCDNSWYSNICLFNSVCVWKLQLKKCDLKILIIELFTVTAGLFFCAGFVFSSSNLLPLSRINLSFFTEVIFSRQD